MKGALARRLAQTPFSSRSLPFHRNVRLLFHPNLEAFHMFPFPALLSQDQTFICPQTRQQDEQRVNLFTSWRSAAGRLPSSFGRPPARPATDRTPPASAESPGGPGMRALFWIGALLPLRGGACPRRTRGGGAGGGRRRCGRELQKKDTVIRNQYSLRTAAAED